MSKIIDFQKYKDKKNNTYKNSEERKALDEQFWKDQELWDRFYDYIGQEIYDYVYGDNIITEDWMDAWGFHCESEVYNYLDNWRGNSEEEFQKWLKENNYEL